MLKKIVCMLLLAWACFALAPAAEAQEKKELKLVYVEWDCATASTYLAKAVLEEKLGYKVSVLPVSMPLIWQSLVSGDADATLTAWLPETHRVEFERIKEHVEVLGILATGARIGLVVPDYVPLKSIEELAAVADKFDGAIVGIDAGAGVMRLTEKAIKEYKLPLELIDGSGATMTAALSDAIQRKQWIVVTGWSPHWKFGRWKLHYLEDSKKVYGETETIYGIANKKLKQNHPEAWEFLKRMQYKDVAQFQAYMNWNQEANMTPERSARRFMQENPDLIEEWLKK